MSRILPLERCRKMPVAEHEGFSDTDSDEEKDSDYEEVVIPNVKRKISSRQNSIPNRRYQKYIHYVEFQQKSRPKRRTQVSRAAPGPPGKPSKRFKPSKSKPSSIPSRR